MRIIPAIAPAELLRPTLLVGVSLLTMVACRGTHEGRGESAVKNDDATPTQTRSAVAQILPTAKLDTYRKAMPKMAWGRLATLFDHTDTLWYDKDVMIPSYQDSVGDGSYTPIGARANSQGKSVIVPEGKKLFSADGKTWAFPFAHTAGTDASDNIQVANFLHLPTDAQGQRLPVVYWTTSNNSALGGLGLHQWKWMFPKGTVFGEMIYIKAADGSLYPAELRTRERFTGGWATNVFRPFPTAASLAAAIKRARPDWATRDNLQRFVDHLENDGTLVAKTVASPAFKNVFQQSGAIDTLPALGDEALVKELLTTTPFVSSYGEAWKSNGSQTTFAASGSERLGLFPTRYEGGLIEVRDESCHRCHKDAGRSINDFVSAAVLYGDIWGSDQIFSFHPWDQSRYPTFNTENRSVRPEFARDGLVVRYEPTRHPASIYSKLD